MSEYFIDFRGYCSIEAENFDDAKEKFWDNTQPPSSVAYDEYYDIEGIEGSDENISEEEIHRRIDSIEITREEMVWDDLEYMLEGFFCDWDGGYTDAQLRPSRIEIPAFFRNETSAWIRFYIQIAMMKYKGPYRTI